MKALGEFQNFGICGVDVDRSDSIDAVGEIAGTLPLLRQIREQGAEVLAAEGVVAERRPFPSIPPQLGQDGRAVGVQCEKHDRRIARVGGDRPCAGLPLLDILEGKILRVEPEFLCGAFEPVSKRPTVRVVFDEHVGVSEPEYAVDIGREQRRLLAVFEHDAKRGRILRDQVGSRGGRQNDHARLRIDRTGRQGRRAVGRSEHHDGVSRDDLRGRRPGAVGSGLVVVDRQMDLGLRPPRIGLFDRELDALQSRLAERVAAFAAQRQCSGDVHSSCRRRAVRRRGANE